MGEALDRAKIEELLAGSTTPSVEPIDLPKSGLRLYVRKELPQSDLVRIGTYVATGDEDDQEARGIMACLRYALVSEDGQALLKNYGEAAGLVDALDQADFLALAGAMGKLHPVAVEDVPSGKAPSSRAKRSSASTTPASS